MSALAFYLF